METTNNRQAGGNMIKGILIGSAVGAAAAMLLTPKSGKDMRETIRRRSSDLTTAARERAITLADKAKEKAGDVSGRVNELGKAAADKVASAAEQTAGMLQSMRRSDEGVKPNGSSAPTGTNGASRERP